MRRLVEVIVPARLGANFRLLLASSWATNVADGISLAAGPLLVASLTDDAFVVGLSWLLGRLPWLLLGLQAGVAADRHDRRRLLIVANGVRVAVIAVLAVAIATDAAGVGFVLVALFVIGSAEVLADSVSTTLLPMILGSPDLGTGNARLVFGIVGLNQLIGPSLGAALFAIGASVPFVAQAVVIACAVVLVTRLRIPRRVAASTAGSRRAGVAREILDGLRWLWHNAAMRTLALTILTFNVTFGAAFSVLVVLATQRLGLGSIGFGLLTSMTAAGGILGTVVYGATERRVGVAAIMRVGLVVETLTHLVLATATTAWPALVAMFVFGIHVSMWATTSTSVRQASVPEHFQGRVGSVYNVGLQGGLVVGAAVGAALAGSLGVTAPYWFGFVGSAVILVVIWSSLANIASAGNAAG